MAKTRRRKSTRLSGSITNPTEIDRSARLAIRWQRLGLALVFAVIVAALTERVVTRRTTAGPEIDFDAIAQQTVKASFAFKSELLAQTEEARNAAEIRVPRRYTVDAYRVERAIESYDDLVNAIATARDTLATAIAAAIQDATTQEAFDAQLASLIAEAAAALRDADGPLAPIAADAPLLRWLTPDPESLPRIGGGSEPESDTAPASARIAAEDIRFSQFQTLADAGRAGLWHALGYGVLDSPATAPPNTDDTVPAYVILRDQAPADLPAAEELSYASAPTREAARDRLLRRIGAALTPAAARTSPTAASETTTTEAAAANALRASQNAAFAVAELALSPTLIYDEATTESERERARRAVDPIMRDIRRGEIIQDDGVPWDAQSISDYRTMTRISEGGDESAAGIFSELVANVLFAGLALLCLVRSMRLVTPKDQNPVTNLNVALLILGATMIGGRVAMYFDPSGLIVPVAAGAILLAILTNVGLAATHSFLAALLVSVQFGFSWQVFAIQCAMSLGGALTIFKVRKRRDMSNAAVKATVVGLVAVVAADMATGTLIGERVYWLSEEATRHLLLVGLNGVVCLFLVPGLLSPLERLFGITTDIQLLEYSDLNNEVLSRLAIEIPATYAHSLMLGQLAEAACDAIGANGLKARVCAYYHDIGKLRRPEYFYENQTGHNVHEGMPPRLSARAIASHVTEGAEMAREFHLPKPFIDAIYEHHGTCLISFFYQLAKEEQKHGGLREEDFRYPGPKPQSRETAVLMICDAAESAVRSLKNPNEDRVRELVSKLAMARLDDRQFDECDVTMRELDTITDVISTRLAATMHRRMAYPGQQESEEAKTGNIVRMTGASE